MTKLLKSRFNTLILGILLLIFPRVLPAQGAMNALTYVPYTGGKSSDIIVYNYTGSPTDDGYLASPAGKQTIAGQISPQSFVAQYTAYEKQPTYFSMPRQARLGLVFNF